MLNEFIAYGAEGGAVTSRLMAVLPMYAVLGAFFYFVLIRPQRKKQKAHKEMLNSISEGDQCITAGGIIGEAVSINDEVVVLRVDKGVKLTFKRSSISSVKKK